MDVGRVNGRERAVLGASGMEGAESGVVNTGTWLDVMRSRTLLTKEVLAGVVTSLALVPEVISFSFISGVDPRSALFASVVLLLVTSIFGGRSAMVTAAAGSVALVVGPMVHAHGAQYILPAVLLGGVIQIAFGALGLAKLARFIPRSVMVGFVNALGILIFCAQIPHLIHKPLAVYALFAVTIVIMLGMPRITKAIPSALVAIVAATLAASLGHLSVPTVGANQAADAGLIGWTQWDVPFDLETLSTVWRTSISIALVGLLESLLTAKLVDDITETRSSKSRESWALGLANICAGLYGGIAGCAMIGQTVVNVGIGGARSRVSTVAAALSLLILLTGLSAVMSAIPVVSLAAVMMIVAIKTADWHSVRPATLLRMPWMETSVMLLTVALTVYSGNLALGVICGSALALLWFARRAAGVIKTDRWCSDDGATAYYAVRGPLFFGSSNELAERFHYAGDPSDVKIDLSAAHVLDASTVAALDSIRLKYAKLGIKAEFHGLDELSQRFHARLSGQLNVS
ncbi:putative sulfate transporter YbaR [Pararobbsia alpina]